MKITISENRLRGAIRKILLEQPDKAVTNFLYDEALTGAYLSGYKKPILRILNIAFFNVDDTEDRSSLPGAQVAGPSGETYEKMASSIGKANFDGSRLSNFLEVFLRKRLGAYIPMKTTDGAEVMMKFSDFFKDLDTYIPLATGAIPSIDALPAFITVLLRGQPLDYSRGPEEMTPGNIFVPAKDSNAKVQVTYKPVTVGDSGDVIETVTPEVTEAVEVLESLIYGTRIRAMATAEAADYIEGSLAPLAQEAREAANRMTGLRAYYDYLSPDDLISISGNMLRAYSQGCTPLGYTGQNSKEVAAYAYVASLNDFYVDDAQKISDDLFWGLVTGVGFSLLSYLSPANFALRAKNLDAKADILDKRIAIEKEKLALHQESDAYKRLAAAEETLKNAKKSADEANTVLEQQLGIMRNYAPATPAPATPAPAAPTAPRVSPEETIAGFESVVLSARDKEAYLKELVNVARDYAYAESQVKSARYTRPYTEDDVIAAMSLGSADIYRRARQSGLDVGLRALRSPDPEIRKARYLEDVLEKYFQARDQVSAASVATSRAQTALSDPELAKASSKAREIQLEVNKVQKTVDTAKEVIKRIKLSQFAKFPGFGNSLENIKLIGFSGAISHLITYTTVVGTISFVFYSMYDTLATATEDEQTVNKYVTDGFEALSNSKNFIYRGTNNLAALANSWVVDSVELSRDWLSNKVQADYVALAAEIRDFSKTALTGRGVTQASYEKLFRARAKVVGAPKAAIEQGLEGRTDASEK